jgi:hypothetical protein
MDFSYRDGKKRPRSLWRKAPMSGEKWRRPTEFDTEVWLFVPEELRIRWGIYAVFNFVGQDNSWREPGLRRNKRQPWKDGGLPKSWYARK